MKRPERSRRSWQVGALDHLESRQLLTMAAAVTISDLTVGAGASLPAVDLSNYFKDDAAKADSLAIVDTSLGTIPVVLTPTTSPGAVAQFVANVDGGRYTKALVQSSDPGTSWSAGGTKLETDGSLTTAAATANVAASAAAPRARGAVALAAGTTGALSFRESNAAAVADGSTVIGRVVSPEGLAAMDAVAAVPVPSTSPLAAPLDKAPLMHYTPGQPAEAYNLTLINGVTKASAYYTATSDNPGVAAATVTGSGLQISPGALGTAHLTVVGYGSDGTPAVETFTVDVAGYPATATPAPATTANPTDPNAATVLPASAPLATPVAPPASVVLAAGSGTAPTSAIVGGRVNIRQAVTLTNGPVAINQAEQVTLSLASADGSASYTIGSATAKAKLAPGKATRVVVSASRLDATIPPGTYHLVATVNDAGGSTTVATGRIITVRAKVAAR